jgi:hypothetical protein
LEKLKHEKFAVTSVSIYKDISGIIQLCSASGGDEITQIGPLGRRSTGASVSAESFVVKKEELDEQRHETDFIDLLLYGDEEKKSSRC